MIGDAVMAYMYQYTRVRDTPACRWLAVLLLLLLLLLVVRVTCA